MDPEPLDRRIVAALARSAADESPAERLAAEDASLPSHDLVVRVADAVGRPTTEVQRRLRELHEADLVEGYRPRVDYDALGYTHVAVLRLSVDAGAVDAVCERLRTERGMVDVYRVTGRSDVVAVGRFRNADAMNRLVRRLLVDGDVAALESDVVIESVRDHAIPGPADAE